MKPPSARPSSPTDAQQSDTRAALDAFWRDLVECDRDLPAVLQTVASRVVDLFGDGCVLTRIGATRDELVPEVILHRDDAVTEAMRSVLATGPSRVGEGIAGTVAVDRRSVLLAEVPPGTFESAAPERYRSFLRAHPMRSLMVVPMQAGSELVGTLGAFRTESDVPYDTEDLRLLESLAERAASAIADAARPPESIDASDYEAIYRHLFVGVLLTTADGEMLAVNPAASAALGASERELIEAGLDRILVADGALAEAFRRRAAVGHFQASLQLRRWNGTVFPADVESTVFSRPDGTGRASIVFLDRTHDAKQRSELEARVRILQREADEDHLTGLLNRRGLLMAAHHALAAADRHGSSAQVIFIDVDSLKKINDSYGHAAGDDAIVAVANAIASAVREADVAGRIGGDEFVIVAMDTPTRDVAQIIDRIRAHVAAEGLPWEVQISAGSAERPPDSPHSLETLIEDADRDLYQQRMLRRIMDDHTDAGSD